MFKKILVANRGEIAVRVMRACRELGVSTVAIYSEPDSHSLHVKLADESYCIGPATPARSYLNVPSIISVAEVAGADAIHPGYGFLAENAKFAEVCADHQIRFIGPSPDSIRRMGDKSVAKLTASKAGVPVVPGSEGILKDEAEIVRVAKRIGFPVMVKASAGGGGKGMRVVMNEAELPGQVKMARTEAQASFGVPDVYLEKFIEEPRHVEIQILADRRGHTIHLGERDCSIQRRHQKLVEESPSPAVDERLRRRMGSYAIKMAKAVRYEGVGTIEFLLDKKGKFYFMEMNTRIQVEHPVTEMVTSIDIVKEQIRIAAGEDLKIRDRDIRLYGHAIECRINAEDPTKDFRPCPGEINLYLTPGGPGVRVDSHVYDGYQVLPYYDSLLSKLICWGKDRAEAISRMDRALDEYVISGISTTIPFHQKVMEDADFIAGKFSTNFIQEKGSAFTAEKEEEVPASGKA